MSAQRSYTVSKSPPDRTAPRAVGHSEGRNERPFCMLSESRKGERLRDSLDVFRVCP
jgi:hypothetical protein